MTTAREAGVAAAAALSDCHHERVEPVTLLSGEVVGALCVTCLREVPMSYYLA